ncbi:MAG: arginase, partial [Rubrobacteraceae bacterium]|nr:arginase [Rubrobacteraceae bacterium]
MDLGQDRRGVDMGPSAIRYARLEASLEDLGHRVTDLGNAGVPIPETVVTETEVKHLAAVRGVCEEVSDQAAAIVSEGMFPIFLGGDHAIAIGTVSGVARSASGARTGVIWVDAHADFNTPETSPSGNIHGMPLAAITGRGHPDLVGIGGPEANVRTEDVIIIGLRSVDVEEKNLLREAGVRVYTMKDIDAYGAA